MADKPFLLQAPTPFADSLIWQLNREYYEKEGLDAWKKGTVPHYLTSNAMVGKTYAELIFAFLRDLGDKGKWDEKVYILELGAGHGRLAFHILTHLDVLLSRRPHLRLPEYCYILSDVVEENLNFFHQHPQFQSYIEAGTLDLAYFDAVESEELHLKYAGLHITTQCLGQPLLAIANYFFDSLPNDLFRVQGDDMSSCLISLEAAVDPREMDAATQLKLINLQFHLSPILEPFYKNHRLEEILQHYQGVLANTYLFFPEKGLQCIENLKKLSREGLMMLSMDKGVHELQQLENVQEPEMVTHGSLSFWVNYHALGAYCQNQGGIACFPSYSTFHLDMACLMFLPDSSSYTQTLAAFRGFVEDFGPDDFNGLKKFAYKQIASMTTRDLIALLRLGAYDSTLFIEILPRLKQTTQRITVTERMRLGQTLHKIWQIYFLLSDTYDLALEIGGIFFDLGYYEDALTYFQYSIDIFGQQADLYYNRAMCYYQLRQDTLFTETVKEGKSTFPSFERFEDLDKLDLNAV